MWHFILCDVKCECAGSILFEKARKKRENDAKMFRGFD